MKVRAIKSYNDLQLKKFVTAGTEFEVSDARAKALSTTENASKMALVEIIEEVIEKPKKKATKKEEV